MTDVSLPQIDEIRKLCDWLFGNPDMADRFQAAPAVEPEHLYITKYNPYYIENLKDPQKLDEILAKLTDKETNNKVVDKLLFKGVPKIGKTRAAYEKVIKRLGDFIVFCPSPAELGRLKRSDVNTVSTVEGLNLVLFLDDLDEYVVNPGVDMRGLVSRLEGACHRLVVVATLRTDEETDKIMSDRQGRGLLYDFQELGFRGISDAEAMQLAKAAGKQDFEFDNATPGSVVLDLEEMRLRLKALGADERAVCNTLGFLSLAFMPAPEKNLVRTASDALFKTAFSKDLTKWNLCTKKLSDNGLVIWAGNSIKAPHRDFYEHVYDTDRVHDRGKLDALEKMFVGKKYVKGLLCLGNSSSILWDDYDRSLRCYDRAVKIEPQRIETWISRGDSLSRLGKHEHAMKSYKKAIDLDANNATAWYKRGNSLLEWHLFKDAVNSFDRALEIDPKDADAWFNRGISLVKQDNHRDAVTSYDRALEIDPKKFKAWVNKGISLTDLGQHEDAIKCYSKALEIDPKNILAWNNLGSRLDHLGRHEDALKSYNRALEVDPLFTATIYNKGLCLEKLGRLPEAKEHIERAFKTDPYLPVPSFMMEDKTRKPRRKVQDRLK